MLWPYVLFRVQAGKYADGLTLAEECIGMVDKFPDQFDKEERNEKLMYLYGHIARIKSLVSHFVMMIIISSFKTDFYFLKHFIFYI